MMTFQKAKYYLLAGIDVVLLQMHRWDWLDERVKTASLIIGLIVGILTVIKFCLDIQDRYKNNRLKDLEIRRKEEEVRRFFQQKYYDK